MSEQAVNEEPAKILYEEIEPFLPPWDEADDSDKEAFRGYVAALRSVLRAEFREEVKAALRSDRVQETYEEAVERGWSFAAFTDDAITAALVSLDDQEGS